MKTKNKKAIGAGLISAFAASLCCITPIIAMVGGISGISSSFSWMEPFRPYLITFTIITLGYVWFKHIQISKNSIECACDDEPEKKNFFNTRGFLVFVTIMSIVLMGVPYYSHLLIAEDNSQVVYVNTNNIQESEFEIEGMTCSACEIHVNNSAKMVDGVISAKSDHTTGIAHIKFDNSKTNNDEVIKKIEEETGYKIVNQKMINLKYRK